MNNNIFIAFDNRKIALTIAKILITNGNNVAAVCKSSLELIDKLRYYSGGIVITGCVFDKIRNEYIIDEIPQEFSVVVIANKSQLDNFPDGRVFKLAMPLQKNDLLCSIDMLLAVESNFKPKAVKSGDDEKIIEKAKSLLIDIYSMSEKQAYRYIQKKSMDTGQRMVDIARIILNV